MRIATLLALLPLSAALGCAGESAVPAVTVTDSAGVIITLSPDLGTTYATVSAEPVVSLGGPNAPGPTQFFRVEGVVQTESALWVADGQSGELRLFSPEGAHVRTMGGRGSGPGEFLLMRLLGAQAGDSVTVADQRSGQLTVYGPDGTLGRSERVIVADGARPRPFDIYGDGSVLAQVPRMLTGRRLEIGSLIRDGVRLMRFRPGAEPELVAEDVDAGPLWLWTGRDQLTPLPFSANAAFDLSAGSLHFAAGPAFRVRVFQAGRLVRSYGVDREPRGVTPADAAAYREVIIPGYPEQRHAELLEAMDHEAVPSLVPAYTGLIVASDGTVWVGRYAPDTLWEVFDSAGELLGQVEMPERFYPMSVRDDRVAGVWRDQLDVEYVRVYSIS